MLAWLLVAGLLPVPACSGSATAVPGDPARRERQFADDLFAHRDWYRAATEYLRVLSIDPDSAQAPETAFKAALCSHRAGRHTEAEGLFAALAARASSTELQDRCRLYIAAGKYLDGAWDDVHTACALARTASPDSVHGDRLAYLDGLSRIQAGEWAAARAAFAAVPVASALRPSALELSALTDRALQAAPHRPWATGLASAIVPGLGQVLCGYHWDGLTALLLTGASAAITADGFRRHSGRLETVGFVLTGIWYPANILGGANAARRANRADRTAVTAAAGRLSTLSLE
jgi:hypothetical protein